MVQKRISKWHNMVICALDLSFVKNILERTILRYFNFKGYLPFERVWAKT